MNGQQLASRAGLRRGVAVAIALGFSLMASVAAACPVCAQRNEGGMMRTVALGAFIVMPWCVALAVGLYIRRGLRAPHEGDQVSSETTP